MSRVTGPPPASHCEGERGESNIMWNLLSGYLVKLSSPVGLEQARRSLLAPGHSEERSLPPPGSYGQATTASLS